MKKLLLIEDDLQYREILTEHLIGEKFTVLSATNGEEGLGIVQTNPDIDLILLDLMMPNMDGSTFFYHLRNILKKEIPIIILSNLADTSFPEDPSICEFLVKSNTSLSEVVTHIRSHLP